MRFKKIEYKNWRGTPVAGFEVRQSIVPVRICVTKTMRWAWCVDHYDTGLSVSKGHKFRLTAVIFGILKLRTAIKTGQYAERLEMWERGGL